MSGKKSAAAATAKAGGEPPGGDPDRDASVAAYVTPGRSSISTSGTSGTGGGNAPGGLLDYLVSRRKTPTKNNAPGNKNDNIIPRRDSSGRGSFYASLGCLLSDLRNDSARDNVGGGNAADSAAGTPRSSPWLDSFQKNENASFPSLDEATSKPVEPSSSWMSQAWRSVDSAKEWMLTTSSSVDVVSDNKNKLGSSDSQQSSWMPTMVPSTFSTAISNTLESISSLNPFSENDATQSMSQVDATSSELSPTSSAFLPKFASKFDWATKQRNPYQAVTGRDTDYLLYSPSLFSSFSTWWLPWIVTNHNRNHTKISIDSHELVGGGDPRSAEEEGRKNRAMPQRSPWRKKSQPSEASVLAVENLLLLVQQHLTDENNSGQSLASQQQAQGNDSECSQTSLGEQRTHSAHAVRQIAEEPSSPLASPRSATVTSQHSTPIASNLRPPTPTPVAMAPSFPDLRDDVPPVGSFDSGNGDLDDRHSRSADADCIYRKNNQAMHAEMAARLAEGTLRWVIILELRGAERSALGGIAWHSLQTDNCSTH